MTSDNDTEELHLLRAAEYAAVEPWALLQAVRDQAGEIVDFVYHDINCVAARQQRLHREDLLGRSVAETLPEVARIGLIKQYAHCVETGEPLVLDDLPYYSRTLDSPQPQTRRYEMRGVRVETDYLSLNWRDVDKRHENLQNEMRTRELLRASADSMLDPQVLLEAMRDSSGKIVDFAYREANRATCDYLGLSREELLGRGVVETMPGIKVALLPGYIRCLDTGEPLVLDNFSYDNEVLLDTRRYDIRATRATPNSITLTWRDVTDRFTDLQRLAASEEQYRLLAENSTDIVCHVRDGALVWVSPSIEAVLGAPAEYWLGHEIYAHIPPEDVAEQMALMATVVGGGAIRHRGRVIGVDGVAHWFDLRARPFFDAENRQDGVVAALRLVDDEVAAEQEAEEARRQEARANKLYRRSMDSAAVATCLADLEGNFIEVNAALCEFFGYDSATLRQMTWQELTAADYLEADLVNRAEVLAGKSESYRMVKQFIHADGHPIWGDLTVSCIRAADSQVEVFIGQIVDITDEVQAREQLEAARREQAAADDLYRQSVDAAAVGMCLTTPEGRFTDVNDAMCEFFGYDAETLRQMTWQQLTAPDYLSSDIENVGKIAAGEINSYRVEKQFIHADGHRIWGDLSVGCTRDEEGVVARFIGQIVDITSEVETRARLEKTRREKEQSDERYRRSIDYAAVGMCTVTPEGRVSDINEAGCRFFGYDAQELKGKHWQDVTAPEYLEEEQSNWNGILEGRIDSYRMTKHYQHADGHLIWGDLSVSGVRDDNGKLEHMVALITDVTAEMQARELLVASEESNRVLAEGLQSELNGAARYLRSILPDDLAGPIAVSTSYLPSQTLGGDCFDFRWIDDDHLIVYLLDVSGHGVESALVAVSVHNMLRSASLPTETLLEPDHVLAILNSQFAMDRHDDNYLTIFYGVYQPSTATLRYASGGHPPALLFTGGQITELPNHALPVGMFDDTAFTTSTVPIPPSSQILLYSDGAFELPLDGGGQWSHEDFLGSCTRLAGSPDWSLGALIEILRRHSATGSFDDDCCLVRLQFD